MHAKSDARDLLILLLVAAVPALGLRGRVAPPALGRPAPARPCPVAVEVAGDGVGCVTRAVADRAGLRAGDRLIPGRAGIRRGRMAPARLQAWDAPVDLNRASVAELASLDGIGPRLAERIVAARPFRRIDDLGRVRGVGRRRLGRLRPRLALSR